MPISQELKRVYASAPLDTKYVETLEISHSQFAQTFFITNDVQAWRFALEDGTLRTFLAVPFLVVPPTQDGKGQQDLQLTIDNIGREAMDAVEAASLLPSEPIGVVYRVYLDRQDSAPQLEPPLRLTLSNIAVGLTSLAGTATRADTLNRLFPFEIYRTDTYPGLDR